MTLKAAIKKNVKRCLTFGYKRYCPVCQRSSRLFRTHGLDRRPDAQCPSCGALERHRLTIHFLRSKTDLFDGQPKDFLHIAPEKFFKDAFAEAAGEGYLTADLMADHVMENMDITDIQYPDESFDIIYCSHVLEHVPEDRLAMKEFYRTLRPNGWAILNVPITADATFEDPSITDPKERERLFGQHDHVRCYGPDYSERLEEAGFHVAEFKPTDLLSTEEITKYGMSNERTGEIYYCTKS